MAINMEVTKDKAHSWQASVLTKKWNRGWGKMQVNRITFDHAVAMPCPCPWLWAVGGQDRWRPDSLPSSQLVWPVLRLQELIQTFSSILPLVRGRGPVSILASSVESFLLYRLDRSIMKYSNHTTRISSVKDWGGKKAWIGFLPPTRRISTYLSILRPCHSANRPEGGTPSFDPPPLSPWLVIRQMAIPD
ncbi:hypothetical protein P170DRAFT_22796 [Aspergillus steynii IBT 23096]|uniref:Uncharacterized protein n=1 Tax=Aspergillus steynii IBT 23096 TaxID=1392250 RepID=A0A2I2GP21_9EURO|nr:uncharacterized protein P170DRAFT_22796 [Aspergillus steynii IBT 23096]PLB54625.1 hypothetical protein P170DRAFT_22796 [Aspergillus steynii IBT 23096]